jgi:hypothetical protein
MAEDKSGRFYYNRRLTPLSKSPTFYTRAVADVTVITPVAYIRKARGVSEEEFRRFLLSLDLTFDAAAGE